MNPPLKIALAALLVALGFTASLRAQAARSNPAAASIRFLDTDYLQRWSQGTQHEFTPRGQEDLEHWSDMVTTNYYSDAKDGDGLAVKANAVLENYKSHQGKIVRTNSVPRTPEKPAEYLIVALFTRPDFMEAVFARFKIVGGVGTSIVYSHRESGQEAGKRMSAWLSKNGPATEKGLMSMERIPTEAELR